MGSNGGVISPNVPKAINFNSANPNAIQTPTGNAVIPLNSTRVPNTNKNKLIDSKLSSLRHE